MSRKEWAFFVLVWVPLSIAVGVAAGGLFYSLVGVDVRWGWE